MGYAELLRALETEVARQARALAEGAARERDLLLEEARRDAEAARSAALARLALEAEAARSAAADRRALEDERVVLAERRRLLEALGTALDRRLGEQADEPLLTRLADEALPEAAGEDGPIALRAPAAALPALRAHVSRAWPAVAARVRFEPLGRGRSGIEVEVGRIVLDDTFAARIARAWPALEPRLAAVLFAEEAGHEPA